ncbi:hypothetical protein PIIN_04222 [Serendipita indica DSM 11827]|uniref:RRM domain-containing protein n=1 Tax=Serendipita indica (strain DSM 11827) TaxID=1109443 RepID=G4TG11_SERID|nr:hypothetical protein PIIN_04222 [Serendipita indica DSM 11827]
MLRGVGKSLKPRLNRRNEQLVALFTRSFTTDDKPSFRTRPAFRANAGPAYTFGLRPPEKKPWSAADERFDKSPTPRFGDTVEVKEVRLEDKDVAPHLKQQESDEEKVPAGAKPAILVSNLRPDTQRVHLLELCRSAGLLLLEIASPTGQPTACQFRFDTARDAVKLIQYLEEGGFCEGPVDYVFTNPVVHESSRFLIVRNYQDTTETLKGIIKGQGNVALHLIQAETRAGKRRVDAYLGFKDISRAVAAKVALEKAEFTGKDAASIRFVLQEIYYSATEQPRPNYTEEQLKKPPVLDRSDTPGLPAIPRGPYPTIFLGNVPVELLQDKEAVIKRFSVYGPLNEVRIPMEDGKARGMVYLEFSRQEDADVLHHDLVTAPLFLYGRKIRVDYAENKSRSKAAFSVPQQSLNSRSVYIDGILPEVGARRLDLYRTLRSFGEVVDMRAMRINGEITQVFIDYLDPEGASALIAAANSGELQSLGPDIITAPASHMKSPLWLNMDYEPTDVLRVWNVPVRALWSDDMLREAFDFNGGLIHVRRRESISVHVLLPQLSPFNLTFG